MNERVNSGNGQQILDGEEAQFKHEQGVEYVAQLLVEREPFHAPDLVSKTGGTVQVRNAEFERGP